ncbi:unnamed protein product [Cuscuta europaea]|uniref:ETFB lysine methyltransferase n=1 Tax=Cuscuta europaea TaxID=41803 RepID=A0A9P0ZI51_CUSEU|nr:unnamed protein product [Cuscuta europaea]
MSTILYSSRGHFFKHLSSTTTLCATFFSGRRICRPQTHSWFTSFTYTPHLTRKHQGRFITTGAELSTPSSSTAPLLPSKVSGGDSLTSSYLSVSIRCEKDVSDMLSEALLCYGASSTTVDESEDGNEVRLESIFYVSHDVKQCISLASNSIGLEKIPTYQVVVHNQSDWIKAVQDSFQPVKVMERLWIVPEWVPVPDPRATNIILNPGLAFGTGEHSTTKLCLFLLHDIIKGGEAFLDFGTGSGILAIAAIKFGAALSVGFDTDAEAITAAQHNASLNGIGHTKILVQLVPKSNSLQIDTRLSAEMSTQDMNNKDVFYEKNKYDVVIANILLNPLIELANQIVSYAKRGAVVGLSGILSEQIPCILECYSELLEDMRVSNMDGWACIHGFKK